MEQEKQTKWPRSEQGDVLCYDAEGKIKLRGVKSGKSVGAMPQLNEKVDENGSSTLNFGRTKTKVIKAMEKENQSKSATTQSQQEEKTQVITDKELEELKSISESGYIASGLKANDIIIKGDAVERQKQEVLKLFNDDELTAELKKRGYKGTLKVEREITL